VIDALNAPCRTRAATTAHAAFRTPPLACSAIGPYVRRSLDRLRLNLLSRNPSRMPNLADLHAELARPERLALDPADASSTADANTVLKSRTDALDRLTKIRHGTFLDWTGSARG